MASIADILNKSGRVLLAPMAGVTEAPFRAICKRMGAALTYTEMVSTLGLHYSPQSRASEALLRFDEAETPVAVQIFGGDPSVMGEQAAVLVDRFGDDIALLDINMGCPVAKVVGRGEGCALMRDPARGQAIVSAVVNAVEPVPVTVKFRKGWDEKSANAIEFGLRMQEAGAAAVAVHGRTRGQFYKGSADWETIARVKQAVDVPVLGSGDVFSAADVVAMIEQTRVDGVMVARGAQGNPWIFREANALLGGVPAPARPSSAERIAMAREHARALVDFGGERAVVRMRKHVAWYVAEMPGATHVRTKVNQTRTYEELDAVLGEYAAFLRKRESTGE